MDNLKTEWVYQISKKEPDEVRGDLWAIWEDWDLRHDWYVYFEWDSEEMSEEYPHLDKYLKDMGIMNCLIRNG